MQLRSLLAVENNDVTQIKNKTCTHIPLVFKIIIYNLYLTHQINYFQINKYRYVQIKQFERTDDLNGINDNTRHLQLILLMCAFVNKIPT